MAENMGARRWFSLFVGTGLATGLGLLVSAGPAWAAGSSYTGAPPTPSTPTPPGGFTSVALTENITPSGGTFGPFTVDHESIEFHIPAGTFPTDVQLVVTVPNLQEISTQSIDTVLGSTNFSLVYGIGVSVTENGSPYPGTFAHDITITITDSSISSASKVLEWNGSSFVIDSSATTSSGRATIQISSDPDFVIASPTTSSTTVPGATTVTTGKPFLGEGLVAGGLGVAGAVGLGVARRRRRAAAS